MTAPMLKAEQLIDQLMLLRPEGYDLSLDRITPLLEKLGNPQDKLPPVFHVSGTNGKGSFTAFARALLEAEGYRVHIYTSPHLVSWHERFRIGEKAGGKFVKDHVLAQAIEHVVTANNGLPITVFEILSVVMFVLFSQQAADVAIIEVGIGGRFDATNVIGSPLASIIMPVSLDHQAVLGDSVEKIAFEKAGIIKPECPVIISRQLDDKALDVLIKHAEQNRSKTAIFGQDFSGFEDHGRFVYQDENGLMDLPLPQLIGEHQLVNAATAIKAIGFSGFSLTHAGVEQAMKSVYWPGRMQALSYGVLKKQISEIDPEIYIDGGHNRDAASVIIKTIEQLNKHDKRPLYLVSAMMNTKEPEAFFKNFKGLVEKIVTVPITPSDVTINPVKLAEHIKKTGIYAEACANISNALQRVQEFHIASTHTKPPRILFCGSLYLVGDALAKNETLPQ